MSLAKPIAPHFSKPAQSARLSRIARLTLAVTVAATLGASTMKAQSTTWNGATDTDWLNTANWSNGVPTASNTATINTNTGNQPVLSGAGNTATINVGSTSASGVNTSLNILAGGSLVSSSVASIGQSVNSKGNATVSGAGAQWLALSTFTVGSSGNGTLLITNGGNVTGSGSINIGSSASGIGAATVDGAASIFSSSGTLTVANNGQGSLSILGGSKVTSGSGFLGSGATGNGTVTVDGIGSSWQMSSSLTVGTSGRGNLSITGGGNVTNNAGTIAHFDTGNGTVTVSGSGSRWLNSSTLIVANGGNGTLAITSGGNVTNTAGTIGSGVSGVGYVSVSDAGSIWINSSTLIVGSSGNGTLSIANGGNVTAVANITLGSLSAGNGNVTVDGAGSTLQTNAWLNVGGSGHGNLFITNGGSVGSVSANLGASTGSQGEATITGADSIWVNSGNFVVGRTDSLGQGQLSMGPGGALSTGNFFMTASGSLVEYLSTADASGYGTISVAGTTTLNGILTVLLLDDFEPQSGDQFQLFSYGAAIVGDFSLYNLPMLGPNLSWDTSALTSTGMIFAVPEPAFYATLISALALGAALCRRQNRGDSKSG